MEQRRGELEAALLELTARAESLAGHPGDGAAPPEGGRKAAQGVENGRVTPP
jgi:hypothetical protein